MWVIDASALAALRERPASLYERLTELVEAHELTFCTQVLAELRRREAPAFKWAHGIRKQRCHTTASHEEMQDVLEDVPSLSDDDGPRVTSAAWSVAQAVCLAENTEVTMVTEDVDPVPTRMTVAEGCRQFDIPFLTLPDFRGQL